MPGYYSEKLSAERLRRCYELAPPRVRQYLEAEIAFARDKLRGAYTVLELGCGYGRVSFRLAEAAGRVVGIDTSAASLALARTLSRPDARCDFLSMDAAALAFREGVFDVVVCIQNGLGVFGVDPGRVMREALRVLRPGGRAFFSSYHERFWPERLRWFELQAAAGLVGAIDYARTGNGMIVCRDGLRAGTLSPADFYRLGDQLGVVPKLIEVDGSSLFCEIRRPPATTAP